MRFSRVVDYLAGWLERLTANAYDAKISWVRSQHPPTQWMADEAALNKAKII
jgi:hypothetical protein